MTQLNDADVLIQDCAILTMSDRKPIIQKGFISIKNKQITAIGKSTRKSHLLKADETISARGKIALPGLINCHTHVAMTLFRGAVEDKKLDDWLREAIWPLEARLEARDVYDGALLGCLEMIKSGTTCFADMYFHEDTVARAVKNTGMRAVLAEGIIEAGSARRGEQMLRNAITTAESLEGYADGRVSPRLGPHAVYSCSPDLLNRVKEAALKLRVGIHMHLAESLMTRHGQGEVELLDHIGFLNGIDLLAAHCIHLSAQEMLVLKKKSVKVSYNPVANMKLGMGVPKINHLVRLGITVGLGTDGPASNNTLDMFETMKIASLFQKASYLDPEVLPAETVLRMATIDGARALGLDKHIGSLEAGKRADIVLVDLNKPHLTPCHNIYANIVYAANGSDVDTVVLDGKIVMREREVQTLKEESVKKRARHTASRIVAKVY